MIIKIWRYECGKDRSRRPRTKQTDGFDIAFGCASYIFGVEAPEEQKEAFEDSNVLVEGSSDAVRAGDYLAQDDGEHEILGHAGHNLGTEEIDEQIKEMAVLTSAAGLDYFYHYTWSHRPGVNLTARQMEKQNRTIRHVLEAQDCPCVEATHGEKKHRHGHGILLSVDKEGRGKPLAHSWYIEALHIAIAVVERDDGLEPEPLRRYIATERGVFNLMTGDQVADRSGRILRKKQEQDYVDPALKPDGGLMSRVRKAHNAIIQSNEAPKGFAPGAAWPLDRYARIVAAPHIRTAVSWGDLHRSLAPFGIRYTKVGNTGRLEEMSQNGKPTGNWVAAGAAYSNAALGKLQGRFGNEEYTPPPADLDFRPLTMPVFNRPVEGPNVQLEGDQRSKEEAAELKPAINALELHLKADNQRRQKEIRDERLGDKYNKAIAEQAGSSKIELGIIQDFAVSKGTKRTRSDSKRAKGQPKDRSAWSRIRFILWGQARAYDRARSKKARADLATRYDVRQVDGTLQYWIGRPGSWVHAFTETENLITVQHTSRRAKIDALRLADAKYATLRIAGTKRAIVDTVMLAAELGLALDDANAECAKAHVDRIKAAAIFGLLAKRSAWVRSRRARAILREDGRRDRRRRKTRASDFLSRARLTPYADAEAHKGLATLRVLDPNSLHLASSRAQAGDSRFIDDEVLLERFADHPRRLLTPEVQTKLKAIEAIQIQERRWIAGALLTGVAKAAEDSELDVRGAKEHWAKDLWRAQHDDPIFRRLIEVSRFRPDRFRIEHNARPEVMAWRAARERGDAELAGAIADEMFDRSKAQGENISIRDQGTYTMTRTTYSQQKAEEYREIIFAQLSKEEAIALKCTDGKFNTAYRGTIRAQDRQSFGKWPRPDNALGQGL
jgi:hypothetical protein